MNEVTKYAIPQRRYDDHGEPLPIVNVEMVLATDYDALKVERDNLWTELETYKLAYKMATKS